MVELFARENYLKKIRNFYHTDDLIKVITGVRRWGKSCLMQLVADELLESGVPEKNIIDDTDCIKIRQGIDRCENPV